MLTKPTDEPEMTKDDFETIRDLIHEKSGIYFAENKMYLLKNRLFKRMQTLGISGFRDYFYQIKYDTSQREFGHLMNLVTTNETSFFRNEPQLKSFSEEVLPKFLDERKKSGRKSLRIWSAGCSTGEEPYTLAMIILDRLPDPTGWNIEIIANDISEQVLRSARAGEYSGTTLRNISPSQLVKFFDKGSNDTYKIKQNVKSLVKFSQINLNDPRQLARYSDVDTIFCRNVMIYFSDDVKKQIVRGYYNALRQGGYLYIGHSETLHGVSKAFKLVYLKNALVYQKEAVAADNARKTVAKLTAARAKTAPAGGATRALDLLSKIKSTTKTK